MVFVSTKYKEITYAENIYKNGFQSKRIFSELKLLSLYLRDVVGMKPKQRELELYAFCEKHIPDYNKVKYFKTVKSVMNYSFKKNSKLVEIDCIGVPKAVVDYIDSLDINYNCKKVLFTLYVKHGINKIAYEIRNNKPYDSMFFRGGKRRYGELKKMSNISQSIDVNADIIHKLYKKGLVNVLHSGIIYLEFLKNKAFDFKRSKKIAFEIISFENIGWYYDYYNKVKKVVLCPKCHCPFKKTANRQKYCKECSVKVRQEQSRKKSLKYYHKNKNFTN